MDEHTENKRDCLPAWDHTANQWYEVGSFFPSVLKHTEAVSLCLNQALPLRSYACLHKDPWDIET